MSENQNETTNEIENKILLGSRWWLTKHAKETALCRGFGTREVLLAAQAPEVWWSQGYKAPGRQMRIRGDVAVVVNTFNYAIVTVLWNREVRWTDAQAAKRHQDHDRPEAC